MKNNLMSDQQQNDLKTWLEDTSQPLPESLENLFIEDCLEELKDNKEVLKVFNNFKRLLPSEKIYCIQTLLSRTPDGKAVMPFLDVESKSYQPSIYLNNIEISKFETTLENRYTLDHLLYREFTEALRIGKSIEEAIKIITKIYLINLYENIY